MNRVIRQLITRLSYVAGEACLEGEMDASSLHEQDSHQAGLDDPFLVSLLERGIHHARQGRYYESSIFLSLVREQLSPQSPLFVLFCSYRKSYL